MKERIFLPKTNIIISDVKNDQNGNRIFTLHIGSGKGFAWQVQNYCYTLGNCGSTNEMLDYPNEIDKVAKIIYSYLFCFGSKAQKAALKWYGEPFNENNFITSFNR